MTDSTIPQLKERHGCLTAYLVLAIIANSATALLSEAGSANPRSNIRQNFGKALDIRLISALVRSI